MYAVVAPGLKGIYEDPRAIDTILALYPYAKFRKFKTEDQCWKFLNENGNKHTLDEIENFGETFSRHVVMEYFIQDNNLYYNFHTGKFGRIRLLSDEAVIENRIKLVKAMLPNVIVDPDTITGHIIAIYHGLELLGGLVDVEIVVPDHSVFYALHSYTGSNRVIARTRRYIDGRMGKISVTLRR